MLGPALYEEGREKRAADFSALRHVWYRGSRLATAQGGITGAAGLTALVAGYEAAITRPGSCESP